MATVIGLTAARMLEIEGQSVVSGEVDANGDLILETHDGTQMNAGSVRAPNHADASETVKGIAEIATQAEANADTDDQRIITPKKLAARTATTTRVGVVELATLAEASTGTDTTRAVTPEGVRQERDRVTVFGGVVASYWSGGLVPVLVNPGAPVGIASTVVMCLPPPEGLDLYPGTGVIITRTWSGTWVILAPYAQKPKFMHQIPIYLESGSGWILYSDPVLQDTARTFGDGPSNFGNAGIASLAAASQLAGNAYLTVTSTGIAQVSGLITRSAVPATNSIIARFPIELAPARNQVFSCYSGSGWGQIAVCTDGTIRFLTSSNVGYFPLDDLRWRTASSVTAGLATFNALPLLAGWVSNDGAQRWTGEIGPWINTPGYTIDGDGVCIFEGDVRATTNKATASDITSAITGLTAALGTHQAASMTGGFNYVRLGGGSGGGVNRVLNLGNAITTGQSLSLSNILWLDASSTTTFRVTPGIINSWQRYDTGGATWAQPAFAKTPDGFCMSFGLWSTGTMGQPMTLIPPGWRTRFKTIHLTVSNTASGRLDIGNPQNYGNSLDQAVLPNNGASLWFSLDGISWSAYW